MPEPRLENRGRRAVGRRVEIPCTERLDGFPIGVGSRTRAREQQRDERLRVKRDRVGLHAREVVRRQLRSPFQEIDDPLRAIRFVPIESEVVGITGRRRTMVGRDDDMRRRIVQMRQLIERYPSDPFSVAAPPVGRERTVAGPANGNPPRRVITDVPIDVCIHPVLRRHDEVTQRGREVVPVARLVHLQNRHERRVVRIERGPAEGERLHRRRLRRPLRLRGVRVERVRDQRSVSRHADVDVYGIRPLDGDRFGNHGHRLHRAAEFGGASAGVEPFAIEIFDVRRDVRRAPCDPTIAPERHGRRAGQRRADDLEIGRRHVREIPRRRNA